ncbi:hypothetical protein, partial [Rothia kristinae]|uniref:hypothetical protein n=1 Tax=Rothia kristinae TaxID=37923 RepID=UPI001C92C417
MKTELIETAEHGQIRSREGSVEHVEVFRQMVSVRTSIIGRPRPSPSQRRAHPTYPLNCEEPVPRHAQSFGNSGHRQVADDDPD